MIRPATSSDIPRIIEMGEAFWAQTLYAPHVEYSRASMEFSCKDMLSHAFSAGMPLLWVAADIDRVVGALGLTVGTMYANLGFTVASELFWFIDESHRGFGLGTQLLQRVEEAAKSAGIGFFSMMVLETAGDPVKAASIYRKFGYALAERTFLKVLR